MLIAKTKKTTNTESNDSPSGGRLSTISAQTRLIQTVRLALRRSGHAELRNAEISADQQAVTISGRVPTFYLKQVAQELAKVAAPEHQIRNELDVNSV